MLRRRGGRKRSGGVNVVFFFQAEDGIRDYKVTGVQTCALPISIVHEHLEASITESYELC